MESIDLDKAQQLIRAHQVHGEEMSNTNREMQVKINGSGDNENSLVKNASKRSEESQAEESGDAHKSSMSSCGAHEEFDQNSAGSSILTDNEDKIDCMGGSKGNFSSCNDGKCSVPSLNQNGNCSEDSDGCENAATASEISDLSDFSQEAWTPVQGPMAWIQDQMRQGQSPRKILEDLVPSGTAIPDGLDALMLWKIIINIISEPPKRKKLQQVNTMDDVLGLLKSCKKVIVLTGAGVSVSCGIPDFRSRDGVYARLAKDFPNLPDPQAMFDIHFFRNDPRPFFKFAREIYPGQFRPSLCHKFIRLLEEKGKLLRNYTQNIDTLEQEAGIERVVQCHGSFATATCTVCGHQVNSGAIKDDIFKQVIPHCPRCSLALEGAVMKPDIVFFGESLPEHFHHLMSQDKDECDLLIVIGSSLKVRPVALIPNSLPRKVPQILINRERLHYLNFDVELLGDCDDIVADLCRRLEGGWDHLSGAGSPLEQMSMANLPTPSASPSPAEGEHTAAHSTNANLTAHNASPDHIDEHEREQPQNATPHRSAVMNSNHHSCSEQMHTLKSSDHSSSKRPFSEVSDCPPHSTVLATRSCSKETMDSIVSACHKIEVAYEAQDSSHKHHEPGSSHHSAHHTCQHHHKSKTLNQRDCTALETAPCTSSASQDKSSSKCTTSSNIDSNHAEGTESSEVECSNAKRPRLEDDASKGDEQAEGRSAEPTSNLDLELEAERKELLDESSQEGSIEEIRKMWQGKRRISLAQRLSEGQMLYLPPSRYVFKGAEVFSESESEDSDDGQDDDSSSSSSEEEEEVNNEVNENQEEEAEPVLNSTVESLPALSTSDVQSVIGPEAAQVEGVQSDWPAVSVGTVSSAVSEVSTGVVVSVSQQGSPQPSSQ